MMITFRWLATLALLSTAPVAAQSAPSARDLLVQASFIDRDKASALGKVELVLAGGDRVVGDEQSVVRATALGYRAKLTGSRTDLGAARKLYEAVIRVQPRNAEAQLGLGAWHLGVVGRAGGILGRVFGASRGAGNAALDRAVALGGDRAFYAGLAALLRIRADPRDARGRQLAEQAVRAATPTALDRILHRAAQAILVELRTGDPAGAKRAAGRLLPFGTIPGYAD